MAGALADVSYVKGKTFDVPHSNVANNVADCPAGEVVIGDGVHVQFATESVVQLAPQTPPAGSDPTQVFAAVRNDAPNFDATDNYVIAICAPARANNPSGL